MTSSEIKDDNANATPIEPTLAASLNGKSLPPVESLNVKSLPPAERVASKKAKPAARMVSKKVKPTVSCLKEGSVGLELFLQEGVPG